MTLTFSPSPVCGPDHRDKKAANGPPSHSLAWMASVRRPNLEHVDRAWSKPSDVHVRLCQWHQGRGAAQPNQLDHDVCARAAEGLRMSVYLRRGTHQLPTRPRCTASCERTLAGRRGLHTVTMYATSSSAAAPACSGKRSRTSCADAHTHAPLGWPRTALCSSVVGTLDRFHEWVLWPAALARWLQQMGRRGE